MQFLDLERSYNDPNNVVPRLNFQATRRDRILVAWTILQ